MGEDAGRYPIAGVFQFRRPEQGVKIEDVLADEVVELGRRALAPEGVEVEALFLAQVLEGAHVADRRIEPDVKEFPRRTRDLEAEVRRIARDVPVGELVLAGFAQPFLQLVDRLGLVLANGARGAAQKLLAARVGELEEVVVRGAKLRLGAGHGRIRVLQLGRRVGRAAGFTGVAVLVLGPALGALALDEAVGQEHGLDRVVELLDRAHFNQAGGLELAVDVLGIMPRLVGMRRVVVVEGHMEAGKIPRMLGMDAGDQLFGRDALLLGAQHDRRAVGVVGADIPALVAAHLLEAGPDVGLDVLDQVAEVDRAVGIGQGAGDEDLAGHGAGFPGAGDGCVTRRN